MTPMLLAASGKVPSLPADWSGWLVIVIVAFILLRWVGKLLGIIS